MTVEVGLILVFIILFLILLVCIWNWSMASSQVGTDLLVVVGGFLLLMWIAFGIVYFWCR